MSLVVVPCLGRLGPKMTLPGDGDLLSTEMKAVELSDVPPEFESGRLLDGLLEKPDQDLEKPDQDHGLGLSTTGDALLSLSAPGERDSSVLFFSVVHPVRNAKGISWFVFVSAPFCTSPFWGKTGLANFLTCGVNWL